MKNWTSEVFEQVALGEFLASSELDCGTRFGLIAIDNAVEFMLIAYIEIEKRLVGGHISGGIKKTDWANIKEHFPQILSEVIRVEPNLGKYEKEISNFHDLRGRLYHSGSPLSVHPKYVLEYAELARAVASLLFGKSYTTKEWDSKLGQIQAAVFREKLVETKQEVTYEVVDGNVRFTTNPIPNQARAIALVLHGFKKQIGEAPSKESVLKSLSLSGSSMKSEVLKARITELRRKKWIEKDSLSLTAHGRKALLEPFII